MEGFSLPYLTKSFLLPWILPRDPQLFEEGVVIPRTAEVILNGFVTTPKSKFTLNIRKGVTE
jgi:hypothetical protein